MMVNRIQSYKYLLVLVCLSLLAGCSGTIYDKGYKTLSLSKTTLESTATLAKQLHSQGVPSTEDINKVRQAYVNAKQAQAIAADAFKAALDAGQDPQDFDVYNDAIQILSVATAQYVQLAQELGLLE